MFIKSLRYDLRNEIPLGIHDLLQAGPHPAVGGHHGLPVEVGEHLHDGVDEGLLDVMRETSLLVVSLPLVSLIATLRPGKFRGLTSGELWTPKDFSIF